MAEEPKKTVNAAESTWLEELPANLPSETKKDPRVSSTIPKRESIPGTKRESTAGSTEIIEAFDSPLRMITSEPTLHELISYLDRRKKEILSEPKEIHQLVFSRAKLREVRAAFSRTIRQGEESLHKLCQLLCDSFFKNYQISSVAIGEVDTTKQRFTFIEALSVAELYSTTDLDLGNRQLQRLRYFDGREWSKANLVANVVEYQPTEPNPLSIHKVISRIKAEEEIWNKVVDEIFDLDELVRRDKKLKQLSRYVKDIFGLKIVVGSTRECAKVQQELELIRWSESTLKEYSIKDRPSNERLKFVEVKNYLGKADKKRSGWEAMKSVVRWQGKTFEIQIQPLKNFLREREQLTKESHSGFKAQREEIRDRIAQKIPLFGYYRDVLRWLFLDTFEEPPTFKNVKVVLKE